MAVFNQEKELQKLDYELEKNRINTEITNTLESVLSLFNSEGVVLKDISIRGYDFLLVVFHPSGIYAFVKEDLELTDLKLQDRLEDVYRALISEVDEYEDDFFCLFAMLNTPVSQKLMIGRFKPDAEYVSAVNDLDLELAELLKERKPIFLQDELMEMANRLVGEESADDNKQAESMSIKVGNVYRPRSELDPEKYYKRALYGGLIGLHKFYARKILSGIVALLTLNFFGMGLLFDFLEIVLGISKDRNKKIIGPYENKTDKLIAFLVYTAIWISIFILILYVF